MRDTDLAWLAGIIDGEGCIRIFRPPKRCIYVTVGVLNTDEGMIKKICDILDELNIRYGITKHKPKQHYKLQYQLRVTRNTDCLRLCQLIKPYIYTFGKQKKLIEVESLETIPTRDGRVSLEKKGFNKQLKLVSIGGK